MFKSIYSKFASLPFVMISLWFAFSQIQYILWRSPTIHSSGALELIPFNSATAMGVSLKVSSSNEMFYSSLLGLVAIFCFKVINSNFSFNFSTSLCAICFLTVCLGGFCHFEYIETMSSILTNNNNPINPVDGILILDYRHLAYDKYFLGQRYFWWMGLVFVLFILLDEVISSERKLF